MMHIVGRSDSVSWQLPIDISCFQFRRYYNLHEKTIKWMESIAQYVKRKSWCSEIIFLTNKSS